MGSPAISGTFLPFTFSVKLAGSRTTTDGLTRSCRDRQTPCEHNTTQFLSDTVLHQHTGQEKIWMKKKMFLWRFGTWLLWIYLYELQDAVSWVMSFILMNRGAIEYNSGGISLNVVLRYTEKHNWASGRCCCSSYNQLFNPEMQDLPRSISSDE